MIVGDLPQFTAVSIGWHDDVNDAREDIAQAIERVRGEEGVLLLTDMFGGTPSNLGMTFLETDRVEVITGVNLPMLIKLAGLAQLVGSARASPRRCATTAATPSGSPRICCAARRARRMTVARSVHGREPAGHARARRGEVRPPGGALRGARPRRARRRARWTARASWASCCWRRRADRPSPSAPTAPTSATPSTRWSALVAVRIRRGRMQRLKRHRRLAGRGGGPRGDPDPARAGAALPDRAGAARARAARGSSDSRVRVARAAASTSSARRRARARPELASLFDAQLLMLDDPMLVPRAADIVREQRVNAEWAVQQVFHEFSAVFDEFADPYLRERKGDVADLVGRLRDEPAPGVATPRDLLRELDESSVLDRRRADAVARGAGRLDQGPRLRDRRRQPDLSHRDSGALARRAGGRRPAQRQRAGPGRAAGGHRRHRQRADPRSDRRRCSRARRATPTIVGPAAAVDAERQRPAATADGVRIRLDANIEFPDDLAAARYAGAEGIGLYRSEFLLTERRRATSRDEDRAVRDLPRHARGHGAGAGHRPHVRRRRRPAGVAARAAPIAGGWVAGRGARQPPGSARPASEPDAARAVPDPAARAAARRAARHAAHHVPVRVGRRADARGARA